MSARDRFLRDLDELVRDYSPRARDLLVRDLDALLEDARKEGEEDASESGDEHDEAIREARNEGRDDALDDALTALDVLKKKATNPEQQKAFAMAIGAVREI